MSKKNRQRSKKPITQINNKRAIEPVNTNPNITQGSIIPGFSFMRDGFSNPLARMGAGTNSLLELTQYTKTRLSANYGLLNTLYRENWIVKKIIDVMPEDMLKNWIRLESQLPPDALQQFKRLERTTQIKAKLLEGLKWGRLYGGAAGIIIIDGHEDILEEPLELDMIMPGSFKGMIILDRWSGISPSLSLVTDINDPEFGLPEYYNITTETLGTGIRVHHSRVVRFTGRALPYLEKVTEQYWGASELEHVFDELKKRDNTSWNIASLVFSANLKVYQMEGMDQLAAMPEAAQKELYTTLTYLNMMMNNNGMQIIGKEDKFTTHQYSFSGLADVYELFMLDISGAAETPATKIFGRSPAGLNATGESDLQNYYDAIEEKQESYLRPALEKLLPIMCMSQFGAVPDDLDFTFNNCRRPTEDEKKNLAKQVADGVVTVYNAGLINEKIALKELRQAEELTGMWSNITDADIENAGNATGLTGEEVPPDVENTLNNILSTINNDNTEGADNM